jgi:hypothetical protein
VSHGGFRRFQQLRRFDVVGVRGGGGGGAGATAIVAVSTFVSKAPCTRPVAAAGRASRPRRPHSNSATARRQGAGAGSHARGLRTPACHKAAVHAPPTPNRAQGCNPRPLGYHPFLQKASSFRPASERLQAAPLPVPPGPTPAPLHLPTHLQAADCEVGNFKLDLDGRHLPVDL